MEEIRVKTNRRFELIDVTVPVETAIDQSGIQEGTGLIFVPHATAALLANENEPGLREDLLKTLESWFPPGDYRHDAIDDNAQAHLGSAFLGQSLVFPISKGRLIRGTWQNIFLVELDGPRTQRRVVVQAVGK